MAAADLDDRIAQAERALVARDQRVQAQLHALAAAAEHRLQRWRRPGLLGRGAGWLFRRWLLGSAVAGGRTGGGTLGHSRSGRGLPWSVLLPLIWPLLPAGGRQRVSVARLALVAGLLAPVVAWLRPARAPVKTVEAVDLARLAGRWFEIARVSAPFEARCAGDATLSCALHGDHLQVFTRCRMASGRERRATGVAHPVPGSGDARLELSLYPRWLRWLPFTWTGLWVIDVDTDHQRVVLGTPGRKGLSLLARTPVIDEAHYRAMVASAAAQGYPVARLKRVPHRPAAAVAARAGA